MIFTFTHQPNTPEALKNIEGALWTHLSLSSKYQFILTNDTDGEIHFTNALTESEQSDLLTIISDCYLNAHKHTKVNELSEMCHDDIIKGFISDALGVPYLYDSEEEDQINLVGAVSVLDGLASIDPNITMEFACKDLTTMQKSYIPHTQTQLRTVLLQGAMIKSQKLQYFNSLRNAVYAATSAEEVQQITYTPP